MKIDFLTPSQLQYPGLQVGTCQQGNVAGGSAVITGGAFQSAPRDGLFNSILTPDDLSYPLPFMQQAPLVQPQCPTNQGNASTTTAPQQPATPTTPTAPSTTTAPSSTTTAPAASTPPTETAPTLPQQIIINVSAAAPAAPACNPVTSAPSSTATDGSTSTAAPAAPAALVAPAAPAAPAAPVVAPMIAAPVVRTPIDGMPVIGSTPPVPTDKIVTAYALNPRLRSRAPKAQEQLLEEWLGEQVSLRMLTAQSAPIAFVVPDGFNAVDFYLGAIELNPEHGESDDLDQIVTLGDVKLSANAQPGAGSLSSGDQITVTVPWRYASWVEMAPEHLRVLVTARFYTIENF